MKTKHTKGPWIFENCDKEFIVATERFTPIAKCSSIWPNAEANACLMAAAPELLDALKKCRDALIRYAGPEIALYEVGDANTAIAKAEGK